MDTQKKVHHLSKEFKSLLEEGLIDEKGYYTAKYNTQLESQAETKTVNEEVLTMSQVQQMMADFKKELLNSLPTKESETKVKYVNTQAENFDIIDNIEELQNWEVKQREYRLVNNQRPLWRSIQRAHTPQSSLQYFDKKTGKTHTMRYSPNQPSFFVENQSKDPNAIMDVQIAFNFGTLVLGIDDTNLQKFLHIHKHNGVLFEEYDASKVSKLAVVSRKLRNTAENLIDTIGKLTNRAVASLESAGYIEDWTDEQVEEAIWVFVENNPKKYIEYCEDPNTKVKGIVKMSIAKGYLIYKNYKFYDTNMEKIIDVARDKSEVDEMATHLMSGEGRNLYEYLANK